MTRVVRVGDVLIGGGNPVIVQSMTNTRISDVPATVEQVRRLIRAGCEIVRVAVPDMEAAQAIREIKRGDRDPAFRGDRGQDPGVPPRRSGSGGGLGDLEGARPSGPGTIYAHGEVVIPKVSEERLAEEFVTLVPQEVKEA